MAPESSLHKRKPFLSFFLFSNANQSSMSFEFPPYLFINPSTPFTFCMTTLINNNHKMLLLNVYGIFRINILRAIDVKDRRQPQKSLLFFNFISFHCKCHSLVIWKSKLSFYKESGDTIWVLKRHFCGTQCGNSEVVSPKVSLYVKVKLSETPKVSKCSTIILLEMRALSQANFWRSHIWNVDQPPKREQN